MNKIFAGLSSADKLSNGLLSDIKYKYFVSIKKRQMFAVLVDIIYELQPLKVSWKHVLCPTNA